MNKLKKIFSIKFFLRLVVFILILLGFTTLIFIYITKINAPENCKSLNIQRKKISDNFYTVENSWIKKNKYGLFEMYIEAKSPYELGYINGLLSQELVQSQEDFFVASIKEVIPSETYLNFLKYFIKFFDRNIDENIPQEYLQEIYGVSQSASKNYDFIGTNYERLLNYHAAHDIGHALQGMNMVVGCTSFGVWDSKTTDSTMLIGRNFDFYVGDSFAKNKIIEFIHPNTGNDFMMISWGGMIGTVSGMNKAGLTLTINASKSDYPSGAKTPISILCREILQYATTIDEAYAIAKKRETFVSESIMIGSWKDKKTAIIEKSPTKTALFFSPNNQIICSNHFQSDTFKNTIENKENIKLSTSNYRYETVEKELSKINKMNYKDVSNILRKRDGKNNESLGLGNEMALNQLICHHSIIFKPNELKVWISVGPYQIGEYICYDLDDIFSKRIGLKKDEVIYDSSFTIESDSFLASRLYQNHLYFKKIKQQITHAIMHGEKINISDKIEKDFIASNPDYYDTYGILARYFSSIKNTDKATYYFNLAISKNNSSLAEKEYYQKRLKELKEK
jgi:isopenicillin-N N-acyltransferase-like protein